jgi:dihydrofolate reductase
VRQFLQEGLVDELHVAVRPVFLVRGEQLWQGLDLPALGYETAEVVQGERATHVIVRRRT